MPGPKERDLEATRTALAGWLRRRLPRVDDVALSPLTGPAGTGFSSDTLLFDARLREGARERTVSWVARLEPRGFNVFPFYDVSIQYRVMTALAGTDVPVPRVRWLEEDPSVLGTRFYLMDRVEGVPANDSPPYHMGGWVAKLPVADRERLWWNGLDTLCRIHRLAPDTLALDFLRGPDGEDPLARQLGEYERYFHWAVEDVERYPLVRRGLDWLRANAPAGEPVRLCWGDSRLSNQMFRGLECVAVLDWEMVRLGSPVQDLAWWVAIDRCLCEGIGIPRLAGLPDAEATIARWTEWTGHPATRFDYYQVLALLKFAVIMARIGLQMKHYGVIPPDATLDADNLASLVLARELEAVGG